MAMTELSTIGRVIVGLHSADYANIDGFAPPMRFIDSATHAADAYRCRSVDALARRVSPISLALLSQLLGSPRRWRVGAAQADSR